MISIETDVGSIGSVTRNELTAPDVSENGVEQVPLTRGANSNGVEARCNDHAEFGVRKVLVTQIDSI